MPDASAPTRSGLNALPYTVIRIKGGDPNVSTSSHTGTGFFYLINSDDGDNVPLIVSNKHVLCNKAWLEFDFAELNTLGERALAAPTTLRVNRGQLPIIPHPDQNVDLAAIPLNPLISALSQSGKKPHAVCLNETNFVDAEMEEFLLPATSVLMVGFPNGLLDEVNNLPVTRRGSLATPYKADYQGNSDFVVDIAAFGGSSGSPVFAFFEHFVPGAGGISLMTQPQIYLIGVLHSGPVMNTEGKIVQVPVPTNHYVVQTRSMIHLGICVKATRIRELKSAIKPYLP